MSDVVVIGGGVIGLACADALCGMGVTVTVLEAGPSIAHASSSRANGGFRAQFTTVPNIAFSAFSIPVFESMPPDLIGMHQTGYLLLTGTDEGAASLRQAAALQRSLGVDTAWVEPDEVLYTAARLPPADSGMVRPLARVSPDGKLMVDVAGFAVGVGVTDT